MRVLVTGNLGYVGTVLTEEIYKKVSKDIVGLDANWFSGCEVKKNLQKYVNKQYYIDIRNVKKKHLVNCDAIIHLAAISNDPIGNKFSKVTNEINYKSSIRLAKIAQKCGVKKFIFASSCSVYGSGGSRAKKESDKLSPLTAYARSKISTEKALKKLTKINITCLRFATACGYSNKLRLDLVLNDFVTSAIFQKKIHILSDGKPWRPLINVKDMSRAFIWALKENKKKFVICNVGPLKSNYSVYEIAKCVSSQIPSKIYINRKASFDSRSYKVNFSLYHKLASKIYHPKINLVESILEIKNNIKNLSYLNKRKNFRKSKFIRLYKIEQLVKNKKLNKNLL